MNESELSLSQIKASLFDPMQNTRIDNETWRLAEGAVPLQSLPETMQGDFSKTFSPVALKVERVSDLPPDPEIVIGGLCSIFTGDLDTNNAKNAVTGLRMDQLVESIGNLRGKTMFVIMEDSFFSTLKNLSLDDLKKQAQSAAERIVRWQRITTGDIPDLRFGFTSDPALEKGIRESVRYMANDVLKNPAFADMQSAPIIMMYTSIWTDLLSSLGYIPSKPVVCVEPAVHFVDSRTFPNKDLKNAYLDFTQWLRDNPYAKPGSANANLGIAGFLESVTGDQSKRRTRLLPFGEVPTTENVFPWTMKLVHNASAFAFPLRNSPIFAEAVNWGLWNPAIREQIALLITLENEYYEIRKGFKDNGRGGGDQVELQKSYKNTFEKVKTYYLMKTAPITRMLAEEISVILIDVLGWI